MMRYKNVSFAMLLFILYSILTGCMPSNVRIQTTDRQMLSPKKTNLVAGLREIKDNRPENEKECEQYYEKSHKTTINEKLFKELKMSGLFQDVLYEKFDNNKIDVILDPQVDHFYYEAKANGWTAFNLLFAFTGFPSLIYQLAGGPNGEHYGEANLGIKMSTIEGQLLASGNGEKILTLRSNLHNRTTDGIGIIEGRALSDATYETLLSLSTNIDFDKLPKTKIAQSGNCGSDIDCKGDRICVDRMCVNPQK